MIQTFQTSKFSQVISSLILQKEHEIQIGFGSFGSRQIKTYVRERERKS